MGRLMCLCGNILSDVSSPSINKGWMLKDSDLEIDNVDPIEDGVDLWECHECGSIAFGNNQDASVKWFTPHSGQYEKLCVEDD